MATVEAGRLIVVALGIAWSLTGVEPAQKRMADGHTWTTVNLSIETPTSHCYEDAPANCAKYGRLYTWADAQAVCPRLGAGWRLPTNDEWRQLATRYGGLLEESTERGQAAFAAMKPGGTSGFDVLLGGGRQDNGEYARGDAHGFYWTATESSPSHAWFYNFGRGLRAVNRHRDGEKTMAISVRCIRD